MKTEAQSRWVFLYLILNHGHLRHQGAESRIKVIICVDLLCYATYPKCSNNLIEYVRGEQKLEIAIAMSSSYYISNSLPFPHSIINNKSQTPFLFFKIRKKSLIARCTSSSSSTFHNIPKRLEFAASILPGGDWWTLPKHPEEDRTEPTPALLALRRIWELVADQRWVAFVAFASLVLAAVSFYSFSNKQCSKCYLHTLCFECRVVVYACLDTFLFLWFLVK